MRGRAAIVGMLLWWPACSGEEGASDAGVVDARTDGAPALSSTDRLCAADGPYVALYQRLTECNPAMRRQLVRGTELFAAESLVPLCRADWDPLFSSLTTSIDRDAIAGCMNHLQEAPCTELSTASLVEPPCRDLFVGALELGSECDVSAQCAEGFCQQTLLCGECKVRLADGMDCSEDDQCTSGTCSSEGSCQAEAGGLGASCESVADCKGQLVCDEEEGMCAATGAQVGDACESLSDCGSYASGLYCDEGACVEVPSLGETCAPPEAGATTGLCRTSHYEWCDPLTSTCMAPDYVGEGSPCSVFPIVGAGAQACQPGLVCNKPYSTFQTGLGTCVVPSYAGEECQVEDEGPPPERPCHPQLSCVEGLCTDRSPFTGMCPAP